MTAWTVHQLAPISPWIKPEPSGSRLLFTDARSVVEKRDPLGSAKGVATYVGVVSEGVKTWRRSETMGRPRTAFFHGLLGAKPPDQVRVPEGVPVSDAGRAVRLFVLSSLFTQASSGFSSFRNSL